MSRIATLVVYLALLCSFTSHSGEVKRVISLAPHTTEWVFALGAGDKLVAVSDFSDYPVEARALPSIASHQGVNFESVIRLKPDLIIAWRGGNRPQDLSRLEALGFNLFYSQPQTLDDIGTELRSLGEALNVENNAAQLAQHYGKNLASLRERYRGMEPKRVFFYMHTQPLMTVGAKAWASGMLATCHLENVFQDAITDYPQVSVEQVINRHPQALIATTSGTVEQAHAFWRQWHPLINQPIYTIDPNLVHRFTPRILPALDRLCEQVHSG